MDNTPGKSVEEKINAICDLLHKKCSNCSDVGIFIRKEDCWIVELKWMSDKVNTAEDALFFFSPDDLKKSGDVCELDELLQKRNFPYEERNTVFFEKDLDTALDKLLKRFELLDKGYILESFTWAENLLRY